MLANLELRRRAIADALRAVMAEPLPLRTVPTLAQGPLIYAPTPVAAPDRAAAVEPAPIVAERGSVREALASQIDWDEDVDTEAEGPSVPPLETVGSMSRVASLALFGHA
jgi:hypothetical protein